MEFRFDIRPIFPNHIIKVNSTIIPAHFRGDRRSVLEATTKMTEIINSMGEHSAKAQGINNPITTTQKLRMSDQNLYLLGDPNAGNNGIVLGLLKIGRKNLYVFDENGETKIVDAPCVLDFYIHESRQRSGFGKTLFDTMLNEENLEPEKLAFDKPSDKLLEFLKKHYGLQKIIPQMNNFVIYKGFFRDTSNDIANKMEIIPSPNTALFGTQSGGNDYKYKNKHEAANIPTIQNSPIGRYAAQRPAGSMAQVFNTDPKYNNSQQIQQNYSSLTQQQNIVNNNPSVLQSPNGLQQQFNQPQQTPQAMSNQQIPQTIISPQQPVTNIIPSIIPQNMGQSVSHSMPQQIVQNPVQTVPQVMTYQTVQSIDQNIPQQQIMQNQAQTAPQQSQQMTQSIPQQDSQIKDQSVSMPMTQTIQNPIQGVSQQIIQNSISPQQMAQTIPQQTIQTLPQQMMQTTQNVYPSGIQSMANYPSQQNVVDTNVSMQNTSEGKYEENKSSLSARRYKANGLSEDPQRATYIPSSKRQYIHPAGKPSGLARERQQNPNTSVVLERSSATIGRTNNQQIPATSITSNQMPPTSLSATQIPPPPMSVNQLPPPTNSNEFLFNPQHQMYTLPQNQNMQNIQEQPMTAEQQQYQIYTPQAQTMNLGGRKSDESLSRRFKANGLCSDPQQVIQTAKIEVSKMHPAGKPSGMNYADKFSLSSSSSKTLMQTESTASNNNQLNSNMNTNITSSNIQMTPSGQLVNPLQMPIDYNTQIATGQIPTPQMVAAQIQNSQTFNSSQMVNSQAPINQMINVPMQGVQVTNPQMINQPQSIIPQTGNSQVINSQQLVGTQAINPQMMGVQITSAQVPTNQMLMNCQVENPQIIQLANNGQVVTNNSVPVVDNQMQNIQATSQIINPQVQNAQIMNQKIMNPQPQVMANQISSPQAINTQIMNGGQMGDGQMGNNQMTNSQMKNPQILNTINPSEPLQVQFNQEMNTKYPTNNIATLNVQNQQQLIQ